MEDPLPVVLRQDQGSARVDEQRGVPGGQEPHRHGGCGIGDRPAREVHQGFPVLAQEPPDADPFERRIHRWERHTGEARDVLARGGPEPGEVAPNQEVEAGVRGEVRRRGTDPVLRQPVEVGSAPLPGSARRHPDQIEPSRGTVPGRGVHAELLHQHGSALRAVGERSPDPAGPGFELALAHGMTCGLQPPPAPMLPDGGGDRPVVAPGDHVDRAAHQGGLHHRPSFQRPRERAALEPLQARPRPDVAAGRVLRLEAADALDEPGQRAVEALQEPLAGEERPVQFALGEGSHRREWRAVPAR